VTAQIKAHYREGIITGLNGSRFTLWAPDGTQADVTISPTTLIWSGTFVKDIPASIGESLVAWGTLGLMARWSPRKPTLTL
jgi:hypothetical protein